MKALWEKEPGFQKLVRLKIVTTIKFIYKNFIWSLILSLPFVTNAFTLYVDDLFQIFEFLDNISIKFLTTCSYTIFLENCIQLKVIQNILNRDKLLFYCFFKLNFYFMQNSVIVVAFETIDTLNAQNCHEYHEGSHCHLGSFL